MTDVFGRLYLYVLAGQVALHNQLLSQRRTLPTAPLSRCCPRCPLASVRNRKNECMNVRRLSDTLLPAEEDSQVKFTSEQLSSFIATLAAMIIVVPGHPEKGPLYLAHGLLNVVRQYPWESGSDGKARGLLAVLSMLVALAQDTLPYRVAKGAVVVIS